MDLLFFQDALVKFVQSHDIVQRECKLYIRNQKTERWVPTPRHNYCGRRAADGQLFFLYSAT